MAVDLSGWSKATVIYAAGIADLFGAAVTLIHVFDPEGITKIAGDAARKPQLMDGSVQSPVS